MRVVISDRFPARLPGRKIPRSIRASGRAMTICLLPLSRRTSEPRSQPSRLHLRRAGVKNITLGVIYLHSMSGLVGHTLSAADKLAAQMVSGRSVAAREDFRFRFGNLDGLHFLFLLVVSIIAADTIRVTLCYIYTRVIFTIFAIVCNIMILNENHQLPAVRGYSPKLIQCPRCYKWTTPSLASCRPRPSGGEPARAVIRVRS